MDMFKHAMQLISVLIISFMLVHHVHADAEDDTYWQCTVFDITHTEWTIKHTFERTAVNQAMDLCKKQSTQPATCKAAKEACESFTHGLTNRPMWQCTALDQMANPWKSNIYSSMDDAALAAQAYCKQSSSLADTCYTNMVTCKNLNQKK